MPLYRVRLERCTPYELIVEAPDMDAAEVRAYREPLENWDSGPEYTQDLETYTVEDDEGFEPDVRADDPEEEPEEE